MEKGRERGTSSAAYPTSDIRSKKCVADDATRSFCAPSLHQAEGDTIAHIAVYCSVLEQISEVASTMQSLVIFHA